MKLTIEISCNDGVEMETLDYMEASIVNEGEVKFE